MYKSVYSERLGESFFRENYCAMLFLAMLLLCDSNITNNTLNIDIRHIIHMI